MKTLPLVFLAIALTGCSASPEVKPAAGDTLETDVSATSRTLPEIQEVFDLNKGAFSSLYNEAARDDRNLGSGKIVLDFTIESDGKVSAVNIVSSTLRNPGFDRKLAEQVALLKFQARNVPRFICQNYPIQFEPN